MVDYTPYVVEKSDLEKLWAKLPYWWRSLNKLCYLCCLRFEDAANLDRYLDINLSERFIWIREQKNGTLNEKYPLSDEAFDLLIEYLSWRDKRPEAKLSSKVFFSKGSTHAGYGAYAAAIASARVRAKVDGGVFLVDKIGRKRHRLTGHTSKAKRIQEYEDKGLSVREIQCLSHHLSPVSVNRYLGNPMSNFDLKRRTLEKIR